MIEIYSYLINLKSINCMDQETTVLDVTEQELFDNSSKTRKKCFKYFLQNASKEELEYFSHFINSQMKNTVGVNYDKAIMDIQTTDEKITKFVELLPFAPIDFMDKVLERLKEYERLGGEI